MAFPDREYVSLEPLDTRDYARTDPRGFLERYGHDVILDEVQRAPDLFSYLQEAIDEAPTPGRFVLTGSQHFGLSEAVSESLAGRIGLLHLLPLSIDELRRFDDPPRSCGTRCGGAGTRASTTGASTPPAGWPTTWRPTCSATCGRRSTSRTSTRSRRETSFVTFRAPRWHRSFRKRVVKAPKIHLVDSGLACHLLGIRKPEQVRTHPQRGAIFESWVAAEILKARLHRGLAPDLYHLRETRGLEVDLLVEAGEVLFGVEVKSGATVARDFTDDLRELGLRIERELPHVRYEPRLVYGGEGAQTRGEVRIVPWSSVAEAGWT